MGEAGTAGSGAIATGRSPGVRIAGKEQPHIVPRPAWPVPGQGKTRQPLAKGTNGTCLAIMLTQQQHQPAVTPMPLPASR